MSVTHRLRAIVAALALSATAAGAPLVASAEAIPDAPLRTNSVPEERLAVAPPPTWPTNPQPLTAPAASVPPDEDGGPTWTAAILVGGLLLVAAAGLGAFAGRATSGPPRVGA